MTLLKRKVRAQQKRINRLQRSVAKPLSVKKEVQQIKDMSAKYLNTESHAFFCTQMDLSVSKGKKWTNRDKAHALSLYHASPKAYRLLQKRFFLPSVNTLRRIMRRIEIYPGFPVKILQAFETKVMNMSEAEKQCVLIFDEMSLKQNLTYNVEKDYIEGLQDFGSDTILITETEGKKPTNHALVFMARGLVMPWKQPFGYVVTHSTVKADHLKQLVTKALTHLKSIGLCVKAITCDQGSNNTSMMKSLGVTADHPFFLHNEDRILVFYDAPHLIKSTRTNLVNHNFYTADGEVSWSVIRALYERDQVHRLKMAPKLTLKHINPFLFNKLRVRLATQVLSHSVARGISLTCEFGVFPESSMATANFVSTFNDLFDVFNSSGHNGSASATYRYPISPSTTHHEFLRKTLVWLKELEYGNDKISAQNLPCIRGWIGNINALFMLVDDVTENVPGVKYLITDRLNQDCIENLFSVLRGKNIHSTNPDAQQFRNALRQVMVDWILLTSQGSNCSDDVDNFLLNFAGKETTTSTGPLRLAPTIPSEPSQLVNLVKSCQVHDLVQIENVISYVSGFIVKQLVKLVCDNCISNIEAQNSTGGRHLRLIELKQYENCTKGGLRKPSDELVAHVAVYEMIFQTFFEDFLATRNIRKRLKQMMLEDRTIVKPLKHDACKCTTDEHVANVFLSLRIHHEIELKNQEMAEFEKSKRKKNRKLATLNHQ